MQDQKIVFKRHGKGVSSLIGGSVRRSYSDSSFLPDDVPDLFPGRSGGSCGMFQPFKTQVTGPGQFQVHYLQVLISDKFFNRKVPVIEALFAYGHIALP